MLFLKTLVICQQEIFLGLENDWSPKELTSADLEGLVVLPVGAKWKMGSGPCIPKPEYSWHYVFVWGRVEYTDGFGNHCFTDFCHRYPWAKHSSQIVDLTGGTAIMETVDAEHGRIHHTGNDAN